MYDEMQPSLPMFQPLPGQQCFGACQGRRLIRRGKETAEKAFGDGRCRRSSDERMEKLAPVGLMQLKQTGPPSKPCFSSPLKLIFTKEVHIGSCWRLRSVINSDFASHTCTLFLTFFNSEKHKAENKDRKVLEILQSKDYKIQELEQKVTAQQQEINSSLQRRTAVEEERALMKELTSLREQLVNKNQELKEMKTEYRRKEEEERQVVQALEEEKKGLTSCCAALRADLEEKQRQVDSQRDERDAAQARLKDLEEKLHSAWQELSKFQGHCNSLAAQLSSKEKEVATKEEQLERLCRDFADVQTLYRQSTEHAAEQSHLIKQLEGLNLDTQKVLRNQEEAHTADTTSYQQLYKELSQCYQALMSSEAKLRQSHQELSSQLTQKVQRIFELQAQLQKQQEQMQQQQHQAQHTAVYHSPNKQTNFKPLCSEQADAAAQSSSPHSNQAFAQGSDPRPEDKTFHRRSTTSVRRPQGTPVQRSRSLSPASSVRARRGKRVGSEQRIQDLEELLQLKTEENEELRKAHNKRHERLCLIQANYKTIRDQLKEMEKSSGLSGGKMHRAESWQLRQENTDAVWNELAYLKNLTRKLSTEKAGLEEELDMLRVQAAMDRATVKELHMFLANDHQELLQQMAEEQRVKSSTPIKASLSSGRMEQSFKKAEQLERIILSLEEQTDRLREEKEQLLQANEDLAQNCRRLQASMNHLRAQEAVREEAARAQALAQEEQHCGDIVALEARLATSQKEITKLHHQLLKLRQELGIVRAARDFYRNRASGPARAPGIANGISGKVKFKTTRHRGLLRQRSHRTVSSNQAISWQGRSPSPTKDEWEDMSVDSDSGEEYSDSLNGVSSGTAAHRRHTFGKSYRCSLISNTAAPAAGSNKNHRDVFAQDDKQHEPWERGTRGEKRRWWKRKRLLMKTRHCSSSSLQQRVESLQRHIDILQGARKDAQLSAKELRRANEAIAAQLNALTEQLSSSKQLTQKLTSDLAGVEQQKKVLEMELEQWKRITFPPQTAPPPPAAAAAAAAVNTECSCQGRTTPAPANPSSQTLEAEVKQLQAKLKSASAEVTKQMATNKALRGQLQEKEDKLCQLQDKVSHTERDITMKRQFVEDLKTRLKFLQEIEKSYRDQVEELEKKVKTSSEEATNRKALIESLKRRLNVATTEKSQHEASCAKLKEDLAKKEQRIHVLQARVGASEQALAALERTATEQMEGLTQQSSQALDRLQRQVGQAYSQLEQLHSFIKTLASEILLDVQEVKQQLMSRRRLRQASSVAAKSGLSAKSMIKAKSIAASILNMSENDLADIMETDQTAAACRESPRDQEWLDHLNLILQQKIPSAGQLMEAVRVKMKERKVLTEELAALAAPVSEKT
ncbi:centlein isoform X2 [Kryptolebias marmoratus]|uniref:centlein isoform X2 n=1 Tax=Kryptolebias marmoratus TaxID=37003 RepID=UPI0018ACFA3A|nr:centlein isoform X2 [Kryptolebias marmoratus]